MPYFERRHVRAFGSLVCLVALLGACSGAQPSGSSNNGRTPDEGATATDAAPDEGATATDAAPDDGSSPACVELNAVGECHATDNWHCGSNKYAIECPSNVETDSGRVWSPPSCNYGDAGQPGALTAEPTATIYGCCACGS